MKALLFKELRENAWFIALGLLIFSAALGNDWWEYNQALARVLRGETDRAPGVHLLVGTPVRFCFAFCIISAAVLGWMQMVRERQRNIWAFLFHRPITPTQLFLGKVAGGLVVYFLVTCLPLLVFIVWAVRPGNVAAPFDGWMVMPYIGSVALGLTFYFAGFLGGMRRARWYATRLWAFGAPVILAVAGPHAATFTLALLGFLGTLAVMAIASWASFCNSGYDEEQSSVGKPALALAIAFGWVVVLFFVALIAADLVERTRPGQPWFNDFVLRDGTIYRAFHQPDAPLSITQVSTNRVTESVVSGAPSMDDLEKHGADSIALAVQTRREEPSRGWLRSCWARSSLWGANSDRIWYFLYPEGRLAAYDARSRRFVGSLGPEGFASSLAGDGTGFTLRASRSVGTKTSLYSVDTRQASAVPIFSVPVTDEIVAVGDLLTAAHNWENTLVFTKDSVRFLTPEGKQLWTAPYTRAYAPPAHLRVYPLDGAGSFLVWNDPPIYWWTNTQAPIVVTGLKAGRPIFTETIPGAVFRPTWPDVQEKIMAALFPSFVVAAAPSWVGSEFPPIYSRLVFLSVLAGIICVPLAAVVARWRKLSTISTVAWCGAALALGPAGVLALLSIEDRRLHESPLSENRPVQIFEPVGDRLGTTA